MSPVLAELVAEQVKFPAAALAGVLNGGEGDDPEIVRHLTAGRSYRELLAMLLLVADCADKEKITQACGINPGLAAGHARRSAEAHHKALEYAHLRDNGVSAELAAGRVGLRTTRAREYESEYAAARGREAAA